MDREKVNEELIIKNDLVKLTHEELSKKYLDNKESYQKFCDDYFTIFSNDVLFQLRALPTYNNLLYLHREGKEKFKDVETNGFDYLIEKKIKPFAQPDGTIINDENYLQALWLFLNSIGIEFIKGDKINYNKAVNMITDASSRYRDKQTVSISNFYRYVYEVVSKVNNKKQMEECIAKYINDNPLLNECNNISFLLFANYMVNSKRKEVDSNFIDDVYSVIKASELLNRIEQKEELETRDYRMISKYTTKQLNRFVKEKKRKENKENKKIKTLINLKL